MQLAEQARTLVQEVAQPLGGGSIEAVGEGMVAGRLAPQGGQPVPLEGVDHLTDRLAAEPDMGGDCSHPFLAGTGQEDVGAAEDEGVGRAQGGLQRLALLARQGPDVGSG